MKVLPTMGSMYSGSLRGLTASHNKGGLYFRGRTIPTNPNTSRQQTMRSIVNGLMQLWSDVLSDPQRQAWRDYAANVPVTDSLGQTMTLSGINWLVKTNSLPQQADARGLTVANAPDPQAAPTMFNTGEPPIDVPLFEGDFTAPPGTVSVDVAISQETDAAGDAYLFIAPPQTPGTRFYKGPYQLAAVAAFNALTDTVQFVSLDLGDPSIWNADTVPVAGWDGQFVPLKVVMVYEDGRRAEEFRQLVQFTDATP